MNEDPSLALLKLAAKAADIKINGWYEGTDKIWYGNIGENPRQYHIPWNPLEHDGDALRLIVRMSHKIPDGFRIMLADYNDPYVVVDRWNPRENCKEFVEEEKDPCVATRYAIVRAVAELAKSKP